jgi:hypothetical protein
MGHLCKKKRRHETLGYVEFETQAVESVHITVVRERGNNETEGDLK